MTEKNKIESADMNNFSIKELKKPVSKECKENKKLKEGKEKKYLILAYQKLQKQNKKLRKEND